ncbi:MAG: S8 family serine peptidase, partial [Planctomycetota bacterium]
MTLRIPLLLLLFFLASSLSAAEPVPTSRVTTTIGNRFLSIQVAHDRAWRSDQVTVPAKVSSTSVPHLTPATLRLQQGRLLPIAAHQGKTVSTDLQAAVTLATHPDEETAWGRLTRQVAVGLRADIDPETLWQQIGCQAVRELDWADAWIVEASGSDLLTAVELAETLRRHRSVRFAEVQIAWPWQRALTPDDPYFASDQWHINGDSPADMNVQSVWSSYTGAGVVIAIVDDGLQLDHPDLAANISAPHIDLNGNDTDPSPGPDDFHGVLVAGCAAAVGANEKGGLGVAPEAGLTGVRLIAAGFTDSENAEAFRHRLAPTAPTEPVSVSNNSWGTGDDGATIFSIGSLTKSALQRGVREGREGKGIVYVFASGNGNRDDASFDSSDYDIMQNQEEVLTIGALAPDDSIASYSEGGVNVFAVAPSGDSGRLKGIFATDRSGADGLVAERTVDGDTISGDYVLPDDDFPGDGVALDGTSFASPNAAGAIAILLEANPALTYRDVQHVLLQSMRRPAQTDSGWVRNSAGIHHHRRYGFGAIDVAAAVALAESWTPVRDLTPPATAGSGSVLLAIPDNNTGGVSHSIAVSSGTANMTIERVMLHVEIRHTWRGDLSYELTSPAGTTARIPFRTGDNNDNLDYIFCMLPFWGESPAGQWRLRVIDNQEN